MARLANVVPNPRQQMVVPPPPTGGPGMGNPYSYQAGTGNSYANYGLPMPNYGMPTPQSQAALHNAANQARQNTGLMGFWNQITGRGGQTGNTPSSAGNNPLNPMNNAIQPGLGTTGYGYRYDQNGRPILNQGPIYNAQGQTVNPMAAQLEAFRNMEMQRLMNRMSPSQYGGNLLNMQRYAGMFPHGPARTNRAYVGG